MSPNRWTSRYSPLKLRPMFHGTFTIDGPMIFIIKILETILYICAPPNWFGRTWLPKLVPRLTVNPTRCAIKRSGEYQTARPKCFSAKFCSIWHDFSWEPSYDLDKHCKSIINRTKSRKHTFLNVSPEFQYWLKLSPKTHFSSETELETKAKC